MALFCEAEQLLEESRAADTRMDYASALQLCLEATKTIENLLMTENLPEEYLIKARIKHGDCVNKSNFLLFSLLLLIALFCNYLFFVILYEAVMAKDLCNGISDYP